MPPISLEAWSDLAVSPLHNGPVRASMVVAWRDGYVALGATETRSRISTLWQSRDGRAWVEFAPPFIPSRQGQAVRCGDGVLIVTESVSGNTTAYYSSDGIDWTATPWPTIAFAGHTGLAGTARGVVAILDGSPKHLLTSVDCVSWTSPTLPATEDADVEAVVANGEAFVAVGRRPATDEPPLAWISSDGLRWERSVVQDTPGGMFEVYSGSGGLVALSRAHEDPDRVTFWRSHDGHDWAPAPEGALGNGVPYKSRGASANEFLVSDGSRILVYGAREVDAPREFWTSTDGLAWSLLGLGGDSSVVTTWQTSPFLMRDGVLFSDFQGSWFGLAD